MERNKAIAMLLLYRRLKRRRRKNRVHWVHPLNLNRNQVGAFYIRFDCLRIDSEKFFNYFRMSIETFDALHNSIKDSIQRHNTTFRECIQPVEMLAVAIR